MSNHASRAGTRRYAWQLAGFTPVLQELGRQARAEQQMRAQDRSPHINRRQLRRLGHVVKRGIGSRLADQIYTRSPLLEQVRNERTA